jgi:hypothetical protein
VKAWGHRLARVAATVRHRPGPLAIGLALLLAACASGTPRSISYAVRDDLSRDSFRYCGGYGCKDPHMVSFTDAQWAEVARLFDPPPPTAAAERAAITQAVGRLEAMAGAQAGTGADRGGTLLHVFTPGQLDCFSEAANTTNFLGLMQRAGLLRHHAIDPVEMRGMPYGRGIGTHATAVVRETASGQRYVIDSWFYDNGTPAAVAPVEDWIAGWSPEDGASL